MTSDRIHTTGLLALRLGVQAHHLGRLARANLIPYTRAGRLHLFAEDDLPVIRQALIARGWLKPEAVVGS